MSKIHHIAIQVDDLKKTIAWYKQEFNVKVTYEDDTWAMLAFDNINLALVVPHQHPPHFAITCDDAQKYGPLTPHRDGTASTYIKDPSGNTIEVLVVSPSITPLA